MNETVLLTGVFDVIHPGHVALLREVHERFPLHHLTVGINGDRRARELKPVMLFTAQERAAILEAMRYVDRVVVFEEDTPAELILREKPDVFVKGPDYESRDLPEKPACDAVGATIMFVGQKTHHSSELKAKYVE